MDYISLKLIYPASSVAYGGDGLLGKKLKG